MKTPIKYIVENIDGNHYTSDTIEINQNVILISIKTLHITELNDVNDSRPENVIEKFLINNEIVIVKSFFGVGGSPITELDLPINYFLTNTNDLKIELVKNSKIELNIYTK